MPRSSNPKSASTTKASKTSKRSASKTSTASAIETEAVDQAERSIDENKPNQTIVRAPAEQRYAQELSALAANDKNPKPPNWHLSPRAVRTFILGSDQKALKHQWQGKTTETIITQKYYGDDALIDRCIVTLAGNRGLMLVGEPGTAKSMLSELLSAAIALDSTNTIQGTAGTTEDQIKYSWNFALLLSAGPSPQALVPSPLYRALQSGKLARFEEITRCPPEIQDALVSILSDKVLHIPELNDEHGIVFAQRGFNVIATANTRDRGVHDMSSALKRRFNFETVLPIADQKLELELVKAQTESLLAQAEAKVEITDDVIDLLVTTFHDLRQGRTVEGTVIEKPSTVMSTAEAVAVGVSAGLDACYFGNGKMSGEHIVKNLVGAVLKDNPEDAKKLKYYFDVVVKSRGKKQPAWGEFYRARKWLR
ncbi:ATPase associated with various cellular activities AAA_5 [Thalassoporum mexicanum PCC 7367]|uniref:ATP-binding protein n=1 Tax=Thalassoporum mexicanum TaxID=3457544 RepID=UPI00029F9A19|nr:AAA family ATPase [Pseudanabaena sp. PCC 7367]AFY69340.1 ATPase associated with various cellular activities AAA_5 [Pseudanabaena sp. PCC 7367]